MKPIKKYFFLFILIFTCNATLFAKSYHVVHLNPDNNKDNLSTFLDYYRSKLTYHKKRMILLSCVGSIELLTVFPGLIHALVDPQTIMGGQDGYNIHFIKSFLLITQLLQQNTEESKNKLFEIITQGYSLHYSMTKAIVFRTLYDYIFNFKFIELKKSTSVTNLRPNQPIYNISYSWRTKGNGETFIDHLRFILNREEWKTNKGITCPPKKTCTYKLPRYIQHHSL